MFPLVYAKTSSPLDSCLSYSTKYLRFFTLETARGFVHVDYRQMKFSLSLIAFTRCSLNKNKIELCFSVPIKHVSFCFAPSSNIRFSVECFLYSLLCEEDWVVPSCTYVKVTIFMLVLGMNYLLNHEALFRTIYWALIGCTTMYSVQSIVFENIVSQTRFSLQWTIVSDFI